VGDCRRGSGRDRRDPGGVGRQGGKRVLGGGWSRSPNLDGKVANNVEGMIKKLLTEKSFFKDWGGV